MWILLPVLLLTARQPQTVDLPFPIAVMIDNTALGRPPQGIADADVVYEIRVEGGITRFMAIFLKKAPTVLGPIRSVRRYFLPVVAEYHAMIVHCGADPGGFNDLVVYQVPEHDCIKTSTGFLRSSDRKAPYNLFINLSQALPAMKKFEYATKLQGIRPSTPWSYADEAHIQSSPARTLKINYGIGGGRNVAEWQYDETSDLYVRYVNGAPLKDRKTARTITAKNIIIQIARHQPIPKDNKGRISIAIVGHGPGWILNGGKADKIYWSKPSFAARTYFAREDPTELQLEPGTTWVQVAAPETTILME